VIRAAGVVLVLVVLGMVVVVSMLSVTVAVLMGVVVVLVVCLLVVSVAVLSVCSMFPIFCALASVMSWAMVLFRYVVDSLAVASAMSIFCGCVFVTAGFSFAAVASLIEVAFCAICFCLCYLSDLFYFVPDVFFCVCSVGIVSSYSDGLCLVRVDVAADVYSNVVSPF